ncbi:MAG: hypothetical protein E5W40_10460, partial [Mesorhizobium sp.]
NIPAIALSVGPMLNGWHKGKRTGSGTIVWESRQRLSAGEIGYDEFMDIVASSAPSTGYCNTMGTATTMNSLAEALGMQLPGSAAIPAPYRERGQIAYETGKRIVDMVHEDLKPSDIMTRQAFENAIVVNSAIGGSTNAPIHLNAIARHLGVPLDNDDWQKVGLKIPLIVNLQPSGEYLGEDYHHAGGVPAVVAELMKAGLLPHPDAMTVNGKTMGDNCSGAVNENLDVIRTVAEPLNHGVLWSLSINTLFFVLGSLSRASVPLERIQASIFVPREASPMPSLRRFRTTVTVNGLKDTIARYLGVERTERSFQTFEESSGVSLHGNEQASMDVIRFSEQLLASAVGSSSARLILSLLLRRNDRESKDAFRLLDDATEALQHNRDLLQIALDQMEQGITVFDRDFRLICWNRQYRALFDLPDEMG